MARVRKSVLDLVSDPSDKTLEWYGRAVAVMKTRPLGQHNSWRFQAAIHEYRRQLDPLAKNTDQMPSTANQERYWSQCQHNSWFFLPWHRMYLHHFERIVAAEVAALGGPREWALPYWNYSKGPESRKLPPPFREPRLADGSENPLFVEQRNPDARTGAVIADEGDVDLSASLTSSVFSSSPMGGGVSFAGPETAFNHGGGPVGRLEMAPHGSMHVAVGGDEGWMSRFHTAALDPVFWLHHANIDRLWQVWLRIANRQNVNNAFWREGVRFSFRNVAGDEVKMTSAQVVDTLASPLEYSYDDVSVPIELGLETAGLETVAEAAMADRAAEMIGATRAPFELGDGPIHTVVRAAGVPGPTEGLESVDEPRRVYLHIEHLKSDRLAPSYDVYLGVPPDADPRAHPDNRVGRLALFGVAEASREEGPSAGSGLTVALEVTDLVARLRDQPGWDPTRLPLSFVPVRQHTGARVTVGRVSLYVA